MGKILCTESSINKGNRIIFKAPTRRTPEFKCYPWGIDNTGNPEALCNVSNDTGYIISNVNIARCDATNTADARCNVNYSDDVAGQDIANYSISSHCFSLPTKEAAAATRFAGHRCSVIISGVIGKETAPFWVQAESPDLSKVVFDATPQVRIPNLYNNAVSFDENTNTCLANTNYHSSVAAGCAVTSSNQNSGNNTLAAKQTSAVGSVKGLVYDGHTTDCSPGGTTYPTRRTTIQVQDVNDTAALGATPITLLDDTNDYISINSHDTCANADLINNGTCKIKLHHTRPYNETTVKIGAYYVRTGEAARCSGTGKDL